MDKNNNSQLELFSQTSDMAARQRGAFSKRLLTYIWGYEKAILIIISFIITAVVSFSLGVEKQKRASLLPVPKQIIKQEQAQPYQDEKIVAFKEPESSCKYTIQVASYQTKTYAQKEAEGLKKKGFTCLILSKKGYAVLCVGNFSNKERAVAILSELKKRYRDCFIRRI